MNKPSSTNRSANSEQKRWIVRRSHFPLRLPGEVLGVVEAQDRIEAELLAVRFGPSITIEPEHRVNPELERVVARAVKAAGRSGHGAYGHRRPRRQALKDTPDGGAA